MRIFIESQCGLIDQLWSTALSPRCTPVLCGPRKCAASRDTQSVQIPPLLCTGGAASEYVEFWFALLEMIRIEHWIMENWGTPCFETSNWRCDFQTVLWRMSQPQSRSGTRFLGQGCSLCSVRGLCTVSLRSTSQHLGCFLLGKRAMNRSSRIALLSLFGIPHISHGFTMFYSDLYSLSMPFHGILKLLRKKCQLLFRKRFPSLAGRTKVMMVSAERLS